MSAYKGYFRISYALCVRLIQSGKEGSETVVSLCDDCRKKSHSRRETASYHVSNVWLGTLPTSARLKDSINHMDSASEAILALKPVTFRYKNQKNPMPQFGLIAEDVASVNPDLVVRDENRDIYTVRYDCTKRDVAQ